MPNSSQGAGKALDAAVDKADRVKDAAVDATLSYLITVADDAEKAVATIEKQIEGFKAALVTRKAEAKKARAEADAAQKEN